MSFVESHVCYFKIKLCLRWNYQRVCSYLDGLYLLRNTTVEKLIVIMHGFAMHPSLSLVLGKFFSIWHWFWHSFGATASGAHCNGQSNSTPLYVVDPMGRGADQTLYKSFELFVSVYGPKFQLHLSLANNTCIRI